MSTETSNELAEQAVRALSEGLRQVVNPNNVRITIISSGAFATELLEHISETEAQEPTKDFGSRIDVPDAWVFPRPDG